MLHQKLLTQAAHILLTFRYTQVILNSSIHKPPLKHQCQKISLRQSSITAQLSSYITGIEGIDVPRLDHQGPQVTAMKLP